MALFKQIVTIPETISKFPLSVLLHLLSKVLTFLLKPGEVYKLWKNIAKISLTWLSSSCTAGSGPWQISSCLPSRFLMPGILLTTGIHSCLHAGLHGDIHSLLEVVTVAPALTAQSVHQVSPVVLLSRPAASTVEVAPQEISGCPAARARSAGVSFLLVRGRVGAWDSRSHSQCARHCQPRGGQPAQCSHSSWWGSHRLSPARFSLRVGG